VSLIEYYSPCIFIKVSLVKGSPLVGFASMSDIRSAAATIPAQKPSATIVNIDNISFS
jgi:hypothetical protein